MATPPEDPLYEIQSLTRQIDDIEALMPELRAAFAGLCVAPPWPRRPMLAIMRALVEEAGLPARCRSPRCRRAETCCGTLAGADDPACSRLWSDELADRVLAGVEGVLMAWRDEAMRAASLRVLLPAAEPKKKRARKSATIRPQAASHP